MSYDAVSIKARDEAPNYSELRKAFVAEIGAGLTRCKQTRLLSQSSLYPSLPNMSVAISPMPQHHFQFSPNASYSEHNDSQEIAEDQWQTLASVSLPHLLLPPYVADMGC